MASPGNPPRIVILGGGFSGILTAVNLVRLVAAAGRPGPASITVVNARRPVGRGIAYATRHAGHLLNVAARNMSAFPDLPDHFLGWLRTRCEYEEVPENELREAFLPRRIYGDYLRSLMHHHLEGVEFVEGEARGLEDDGTVVLSDGRRIRADRIVLACGNEPPAPLPGSEGLAGHPAWVGDPWSDWEKRLPSTGGTIVLLGTGLTTVEAIVTLQALGWQGRIEAVSRHGWLPQAHFRGIEYPDFPPADVDLAGLGLERLLALMEHHCGRLRALGANPAIIVDKMRPHTRLVWAGFSREEKLAFVRDHAARWNVLRHRIAPEIHARLATAELTGALRVRAATIVRVAAAGAKARVELEGGGALEGDLVINATGPRTRFSRLENPLLRDLLHQGHITSDELDLGMRVDADHVAIDARGGRSVKLLALGPLLRGTYWETIAVPELRGQARRVAETILGLGSGTASEEVMMEYMI